MFIPHSRESLANTGYNEEWQLKSKAIRKSVKSKSGLKEFAKRKKEELKQLQLRLNYKSAIHLDG